MFLEKTLCYQERTIYKSIPLKKKTFDRQTIGPEMKIISLTFICITSVPPGLRCAPPLQNAGLISRDAWKFETAFVMNLCCNKFSVIKIEHINMLFQKFFICVITISLKWEAIIQIIEMCKIINQIRLVIALIHIGSIPRLGRDVHRHNKYIVKDILTTTL